ncbi:imidazole glycerol phosphate synthase subunit HisF [Patescibacteria group bacterium]|nr:imidazole glycerol phosphate synthase subunit HisF [Patescibacteria group bacterium]
MFVIPAIDIIKGNCVRLKQGEYDQLKIYSDSPVKIAKEFERKGAKLLQVVDLEGARAGEPINKETIFSIAKMVSIPVQVGGGIRTFAHAESYLKNGIEKIILGTVVIENQKLLKRLLKEFGNNRIVVSLDIKDGVLAIRGWRKKVKTSIRRILSVLKKVDVKTLAVTDTLRDGLLKGPNFDLMDEFIEKGFQIIAAGGISTLADIQELNKRGAYGVIVGKALYEGNIDLQTAQLNVLPKNELAKRIIPCLDVKNGRVVKGAHFNDLRDVGDAVELGKRYGELGADEIVFLDISATLENRKTFCELVSKIAKEINIPFTVGGGVSSIDDIKNLLDAGADKVSIGSAAVKDPSLIRQAAKQFGSQCIVISVDAKKQRKKWRIYIKGGTEATDIDAVNFSKQMEELGAGELLVNSLDRDGTKKGFDIELLKIISGSVGIPVIASSGAGTMQDFLDVFQKANVDAALAASVFHYNEISIAELKKFLRRNKISIRL